MHRSFAVMLLVLLFMLVGCSKNAETPPTAKGTPQLRIAYSLSDFRQDFFQAMKDGVLDAVQREGGIVDITDANGQASKQINDVQDLLNKPIDALLITPQDSNAIAPAIKRANAKGIPVIIVDIGAEGGDVASTIVSDNVMGGRLAGEFMAKQVAPDGKAVHIQAQLGAENARKRGEGFIQGFAGGNRTIVAQQPADSLRDKAVTVMGGILQSQTVIHGVFGENDDMAIGALLAARQARRDRGLVVVGFNGDPDALDLIRKGEMAATVMQFPYDMGVTAVEIAKRLVAKQPIEKTTLVKVELVTKENVDSFDKYRRK